MARLLILDINGVLCHNVNKEGREPIFEGSEIIETPRYLSVVRPGCYNFLDHCYQNYNVGFFSSTTYSNAGPILDAILNQDQKKATIFRWFRDRTRLDPDYGKEGITHFDTVKIIQDVLDCPIVNPRRIYNIKRTLIVDDDLKKLRFNCKENNVLMKKYQGEKDDNELIELAGLIDQLFESLN